MGLPRLRRAWHPEDTGPRRTGPHYTFARYFEQEKQNEHLHDLVVDPAQLKNFATDPEYTKILAKVRKRTDVLRDQFGGPYKPHQPRKSRKPAPKKK